MTRKFRPRLVPTAASALVLALLLAACGDDGSDTTSEEPASSDDEESTGGDDEADADDDADADDTGEAEASEASGEVTYWHAFTAGGEAAAMEVLLERFSEMHPDVNVVERPIGNEEHFTVMRTGLAGGDPPDLLHFEGYQQTRDFAGAGQLMDIGDLWEEHSDKFTLEDAGERACTYEGDVYCVPYTFHTGWQIFYNADMLAQYDIDPPTDWDEFLDAGDQLKQEGIAPISLGNVDGWPGMHWWMAFLVQRCGVEGVYDAIEGEGASFTDECFVESARDLEHLASNDYFSAGAASEDYGGSQAVFASGQAAFFQTGSWYAAAIEEDPLDFEVGIMPIPRLAEDEYPDDITGAVTHAFTIPAEAENPDAAKLLLEWFVSEEAGSIWAEHGLLSMIDGAVEESSSPQIQELWQAVLDAERSLPWIENELPPGVGEGAVYNGTTAIVGGSMTPEEFVESIQTELEAAR